MTQTMQTTEKTIDQLVEGDIVFAVNGKPRPFPYEVTRVISTDVTTPKGRFKYRMTQVRFAHGGIIPPCDPTTAVATVLVQS